MFSGMVSLGEEDTEERRLTRKERVNSFSSSSEGPVIFVVEEVVLELLPKNEGRAGGAAVEEEVGRRVAAFFFLEAADGILCLFVLIFLGFFWNTRSDLLFFVIGKKKILN